MAQVDINCKRENKYPLIQFSQNMFHRIYYFNWNNKILIIIKTSVSVDIQVLNDLISFTGK